MPRQPCERWPGSVSASFAEMNRTTEAAVIAEICDRVVEILRNLEAPGPELSVLRQIAYSYYDLTAGYERLGRWDDAKRGYEQARDRWSEVLASIPGDFEVLTQLAACCNHLGLLAAASRAWDEAEQAYRSALAYRRTAYDANPTDPDQMDNFVYSGGTWCNLAHLYRDRGSRHEAIECYDTAIEMLTSILPPPHNEQEAEICDFWKNMWSQIYGMPHWARVAVQFLKNAQEGKAQATTS